MTTDRLTLDDHRLGELYSRFQRERRMLGEVYRGAPYDDFVGRGRYRGDAFPVATMAQGHILAATNAVNRFCYDLHSITAWDCLLKSAAEEEKIMAHYEFVYSIIALCLSAPYSIKGLLITSICQISSETNRVCNSNQRGWSFKPNRHFQFGDARNIAGHFASWSVVGDALSRLNDENFKNASDDYRNRLNHAIARRIEFGHTMTVRGERHEKPHSRKYAIAEEPPMLLSDLVPLLAGQYQAALLCHDAYVKLVDEQHKLWPRPAGAWGAHDRHTDAR